MLRTHLWAFLALNLSACTGALKFRGELLWVQAQDESRLALADDVATKIHVSGKCFPGINVMVTSAKDEIIPQSAPCNASAQFDLSFSVRADAQDGQKQALLTQTDAQGLSIQSKFSYTSTYCKDTRVTQSQPIGSGTATDPYRICAPQQLNIYTVPAATTRATLGAHEYTELMTDIDLDDPSLNSERDTAGTGGASQSATSYSLAVEFNGNGHTIHSHMGHPLFTRFASGSLRKFTLDIDETSGRDLQQSDVGCLISQASAETPNPTQMTTTVGLTISDIVIKKCALSMNAPLPRPGNQISALQYGVGAIVGGIVSNIDHYEVNISDISLGNVSLQMTNNDVVRVSCVGTIVGMALIFDGATIRIERVKPLDNSSSVELGNHRDFTASEYTHTGGILGYAGCFDLGLGAANLPIHIRISDVGLFPLRIVSNAGIGGLVGQIDSSLQANGSDIIFANDVVDSTIVQEPSQDAVPSMREIGSVFGQLSSFNGSYFSTTQIDHVFARARVEQSISAFLQYIGSLSGVFNDFSALTISQSSFDLAFESSNNAQITSADPVGGLIGSMKNNADNVFDDMAYYLRLSSALPTVLTGFGLIYGEYFENGVQTTNLNGYGQIRLSSLLQIEPMGSCSGSCTSTGIFDSANFYLLFDPLQVQYQNTENFSLSHFKDRSSLSFFTDGITWGPDATLIGDPFIHDP